MSGVYVHIPFCRSRCLYCAFYSTVGTERHDAYVAALCREMDSRRELPQGDASAGRSADLSVGTIYIGGGTPSCLSDDNLRRLLTHLRQTYNIEAEAEVTMECNPDDVTPSRATALAALGVNRVSMGAQTFDDALLRGMRRRHTAAQTTEAVAALRRAGIGNISVDIMFGFPGQTVEAWRHDVEQALGLGVEHLSAYCLTYEQGTPLYSLRQRGVVSEASDEVCRAMYETLTDMLARGGYEHYEISNWARRTADGVSPYRSRHNGNYWNGTPYIGLGAAAHSYDGLTRRWNVADVGRYMRHGTFETEAIDEATRYNEMVMLALRTCDGLDLGMVGRRLGRRYTDYLLRGAAKYIDCGWLEHTTTDAAGTQGCLRLTHRGLFVSDGIMADLMMV